MGAFLYIKGHLHLVLCRIDEKIKTSATCFVRITLVFVRGAIILFVQYVKGREDLEKLYFQIKARLGLML